MANLWKETIDILEKHNKKWKDVLKVYGNDFQITKENFENVAKKTEYYSGYGGQEIASDLKISGEDFVMYREEYDGSEWWTFIFTGYAIPKEFKEITALRGNGWETLKQTNSEEE